MIEGLVEPVRLRGQESAVAGVLEKARGQEPLADAGDCCDDDDGGGDEDGGGW